jgi:hypothetical protein
MDEIMKTYQHIQKAKYLLVSVGAVGAVFAILGATMHPAFFVALPILLLIGWLFHSLSIEVADAKLRWWFGPGLIRKQAPRAEIASVKVVRTSLLEGWGIHYSRFGWLYNASGLDAIAITLKNGEHFVLGTDEPHKLAEALAQNAT